MIFSGLALGVSRGSCGVDLVCLTLGSTTETMELSGAICNIQVIDL
jgi:hypothetical protein